MEERVAGSEISIHPSNLGCNPQIKTWGGQTGGGAAVARARKVGAKLGDVREIFRRRLPSSCQIYHLILTALSRSLAISRSVVMVVDAHDIAAHIA